MRGLDYYFTAGQWPHELRVQAVYEYALAFVSPPGDESGGLATERFVKQICWFDVQCRGNAPDKFQGRSSLAAFDLAYVGLIASHHLSEQLLRQTLARAFKADTHPKNLLY